MQPNAVSTSCIKSVHTNIPYSVAFFAAHGGYPVESELCPVCSVYGKNVAVALE